MDVLVSARKMYVPSKSTFFKDGRFLLTIKTGSRGGVKSEAEAVVHATTAFKVV